MWSLLNIIVSGLTDVGMEHRVVRDVNVEFASSLDYATVDVLLVESMQNPEKLYLDVFSISEKNRIRRVMTEVLDNDGRASFSIPKSSKCYRFYVEIKSQVGWGKRLIYRVKTFNFSFISFMIIHSYYVLFNL